MKIINYPHIKMIFDKSQLTSFTKIISKSQYFVVICLPQNTLRSIWSADDLRIDHLNLAYWPYIHMVECYLKYYVHEKLWIRKTPEGQVNLAHWARKCIADGTVYNVIGSISDWKHSSRVFKVFAKIKQNCD